MISRTALCSAQPTTMRFARTGPMLSTSAKKLLCAFGEKVFDIIEAEPGRDRANAADHARAKVLLDAFDRSGGGGLEEPRLKLLAMGAVVRPFTGGRNPLAGGDHGGVANDGDEIAVASRVDPNDTKTVVGILVCDALVPFANKANPSKRNTREVDRLNWRGDAMDSGGM
jgi:hypothetical protein